MAEDEIIKKHTKAAYKSWFDPEKKWFHKLKDFLLEVLIIVFAVSISIWFHNWSEHTKERKEAKEFYRGLKEDLRADVKEMMNDRAGLEDLLRHLVYFENPAVANEDSLMIYTSAFFTQAQINPRIGRFEALKGSGKLDIIEDKKLLLDIIELYQKIFPNIFRVNERFNSLGSDKIAPFLADVLELDTAGVYVNIRNVIKTSKMRLMMAVLKGDAGNSIAAYTTGIDKSNEILKELE